MSIIKNEFIVGLKFFVYILKSELDNSFYIGQSCDVEKRLERHNKGYNRSTKNKKPWQILYFEECTSRSEAMKLEKKFKRFKKRDLIINYIKNRGVAQSGSEK